MTKDPLLSYCATEVKTHDPDRYLWCLTFAPDVREAMFAIVAFNSKIERIPDVTSEAMIGHIRYAWWRETIEEIFSQKPVRKHPVAEALAVAIKEYPLPKELFDTLLDAREKDFTIDNYTSYEELKTFLIEINLPLLELALLVTKKHDDAQRDHARLAAYRYGMAKLIPSIPHHLVHGKNYLPQLLQDKHSDEMNVEISLPEKEEIERGADELRVSFAADYKKESSRLPTVRPALSTRAMSLIAKHFLDRVPKNITQLSPDRHKKSRWWLVAKIMLCITFASA